MKERYLSELQKGQTAMVITIADDCPPEKRQRFLDLGFVPEAEVEVETVSPLKDPVAYNIHNTLVCLRREDAALIRISLQKHAVQYE